MKELLIHIPKNSGSSLKAAGVFEYVRPRHLDPAYFQRLKDFMQPRGLTHHAGHARWRDLKDKHRERRCVAVMRNPWSRTVSRYTFFLQLTGTPVAELPFEEWIETRHQYACTPFFWHRTCYNWYSQLDHVRDERGVIRCRLLRFEHLEEDLGRAIPRKNVSNKTPYQSFYTPRTRAIVLNHYAEEIEYLGYTFDSTATKNI